MFALTRRQFAGAMGFGLVCSAHGQDRPARNAPPPGEAFITGLAALERALDARVGVWILDTQSRQTWGYREKERFPLCGAYKFVACAALLARVDEGKDDLGRHIRLTASDLLPDSPVTQYRVGSTDGLALADLSEAALARNDHTAGRLVLDRVGGPAGLTTFMRSLGDATSRLDRWPPQLNEAAPGDPRDTTTPTSAGSMLRTLLLGSALSHSSRKLLLSWLLLNKAGDARVRAGVPQGWEVGDKTSIGGNGTMNDVAIIWPPNRKPLIVSVFVTESSASLDSRSAGIAAIASRLPGLLAG